MELRSYGERYGARGVAGKRVGGGEGGGERAGMRAKAVYRAVERGLVAAVAATATITAAAAAAAVVVTWHRASERDDRNRLVRWREKAPDRMREREGRRIGKEKSEAAWLPEGERRCGGSRDGRGRNERSYLVDPSEVTEFQDGEKEKLAVAGGWRGEEERGGGYPAGASERGRYYPERDGERWNVVG